MAGKYVAYVGTYTHENSEGIYVYDVDPKTGVFKERSITPINNPSNLTVAHNGHFLYSIADEGVAAYSIGPEGDLTKINLEWIGGMRGCHIRTDSKDRFIFTGGYHDGRVTVMRIRKDGGIGEICDGIFHQGVSKSIAEKRLDPHVSCVELTPDEKFLCACDCGLHQIRVYSIDYRSGKLTLNDILRLEMDSAPRNFRFSADGKYLYVITEGSNEIFVYSYTLNGKDPEFEMIQKISLLNAKDDKEIASGTNLKPSKNERYVFAGIDGINAIEIFKRDTKTGLLEYFSRTPISGDFPKSFAILPGEKFFVSLNHDTDEIRTFRIDYEEGHCLGINKPIRIAKPNCIYIHQLVE